MNPVVAMTDPAVTVEPWKVPPEKAVPVNPVEPIKDAPWNVAPLYVVPVKDGDAIDPPYRVAPVNAVPVKAGDNTESP